MENLKIKLLTKYQILISVDRLTRFKNTETKYLRVFKDILTNNLILPKFKKSELNEMDFATLRDYAQYIINNSLNNLGVTQSSDLSINQKLLDYEKSIYNFDTQCENLLKNKINYSGIIELIDENCSKNLQWLKHLSQNDNIENLRTKHSLRFPIKKVIITEGATEETLLPEISKIYGYDFDKEGVYILSAGGKNQVVKLYYQLVETIKLPIFILLDRDAKENLEEIKPKLRDIDKIHLLKCGEFEDLLPIELIIRTLENELGNISIIEKDLFNTEQTRVQNLEEFFRTRGMHEFKKVEFAQMIKKNIKNKSDLTTEILEIIEEIKIS